MKKFWAVILSLSTIFFLGNFTQANSEYEFTNLDITANILIDGTIDVKEDYAAKFFVHKHGIFRHIPLNYSVGGKDFHIYISNINVDGKTFTTDNYGNEWMITIGDADKTLKGKQNYQISYSTYGLIRNFSGKGYAELYWDLVGSQRDTNFNNLNTELILPKPYTGFTNEDFLIKINGTKKTIDDFDGIIDRSSGDRILIKYNKTLPSYTRFSVSVKFPNNYFEFDHDKQSKLIGHVGNSSTYLPTVLLFYSIAIIIALIAIFGKKINKRWKGTKIYMKIKLNTGKLKGEYEKKFPVIIQYNPPKKNNFNNFTEIGLFSGIKKNFSYKLLNSAEVGLLLHRKARPKDLLSLVYKRAYEKLVEIKSNADESITITKLQELPDYYPEYEKHFFKNLISDSETIIKKNENLYEKLTLEDLEQYGIDQQWFIKECKSPKESDASGKYGCIGFSLYIFTILLSMNFENPLFAFLGFITMVGGFIIASRYRKKMEETEIGAELISKILGYREFLAKCDENKLRLFLKQDSLYFDKILPYAIVFGLETELIEKMNPIMQEMDITPVGYNGNFDFVSSTISTISSAAFSSSSSYSSDSGFDSGSSFDSDFGSDSGGGGGGGGSW